MSLLPVLNLSVDRVSELLRREVTLDELLNLVMSTGLDIEHVDRDAGIVKCKYEPNRPDFSSPVGIVRSIAGMMGESKGLPSYRTKRSGFRVKVENSVKGVRPWIVCSIVKGLDLSSRDVEEIINMQEDLHWILGRDRRKVSIGLHNLDVIKPPVTYRAVGPKSIRFIPLKSTYPMYPEEILEKHETGRKYAHLLHDKQSYPLLVDSSGNVLSFPPIINSSLTEVVEGVRNLFIDVTGTELDAIDKALNIITTSLADMGGTIYKVRVDYDDRYMVKPDLKPKRFLVDLRNVKELIGLDIGAEEVIESLRKCRIDANLAGGKKVRCYVPAYRVDIMHEVDLIEDIAIGYGYSNIEPKFPKVITQGVTHEATRVDDMCAEIMVGMGFNEVMNFTLSNPNRDFNQMMVSYSNSVELANPVSAEYKVLRTWLLPGLLKNLADNKANLYPQRLFEVGDVVLPSHDVSERAIRRVKLAAVIAHSNSSFTEVKSVIEELLRNLAVKDLQLEETNHPSFIEGRVASIMVYGKDYGIVGEINPRVLENFGITIPVAAFEIDVEQLIKDIYGLKIS